ncbi:MAG: VWA domain-containing protein [Nitrospirae bacterium]|nr:VWA domain-containing protein [Nitrospirota bacterium]
MLTKIDDWCTGADEFQRRLELPPSLLCQLLNDELNTRVKFVESVKSKIRRRPLNIDVAFNPPVFPFDNSLFLDPFFLVEDFPDEPIDLGAIRAMDDLQLNEYLESVYQRFTCTNNGRRILKKKELLQYVGKSYYFDAVRASELKSARKTDSGRRLKRRRSFVTVRDGAVVCMPSVHVPETMKRSILRRKVHNDGRLITQDDVMVCKRRSVKRVNILVAIDRSKSMEQCGKLQQAQKAALSFHYYKSTCHDNARVEFVAFNDRIMPIAALDVLTLKPSGMTHMAELFGYVYSYFTKGSRENPEVYVITDGYPQKTGIKDTVYHAITFGVAKKLRSLNVKLKVIVVNLPGDKTNTSYLAYNKLICDTLKGELVQIEAGDLTETLIGL